jgi:hypothetical protein
VKSAALSKVIEAEVRDLVHQELAKLGGHLLTVYGDKPQQPIRPEDEHLARLGGYLLTTYGDGPDAVNAP